MPDNNNNNRGLGTGGLFSALSGGTPAYQRSSHTAMISTGSGRSTDNPAAMSTIGSGSRAVPNSVRKGTSSRGNSNASSNGSSMSIADSALNSNKKQSSLDVGSLKIGNSIATLTTKMEAAINKQSAMIERQTTAMISRLEMINKSIIELSDLFKNANKMTLNAYDEFNRKLPKFSLLNAFTPEALYKQQLEFFNRWLTSKVTTEQLTTALLGTLKDNSIWKKLFSYDLRIAKENKQAIPWNKESADTLNKVLPKSLKEMDQHINNFFITINDNLKTISTSLAKQMGTQHDTVISKYEEFSTKFNDYLKLTIDHYKLTEDYLGKIAKYTFNLDPAKGDVAGFKKNSEEKKKLAEAVDLLKKSENATSYNDKRSLYNKAYVSLMNTYGTREKRINDEKAKEYSKPIIAEMTDLFNKASSGKIKDPNEIKQLKSDLIKFYDRLHGGSKNLSAAEKSQRKMILSRLANSNTLLPAQRQQLVGYVTNELTKIVNNNADKIRNKRINYKNFKDTSIDILEYYLGEDTKKKLNKDRDDFLKNLGKNNKSTKTKNYDSFSKLLVAIKDNSKELEKASNSTNILNASMLAFQRFANPKSILSILMTAFKWWGMYRMLGLGTHVIRWLRDRPLIRAGGEFIKLWIWNPAKQYLIDPLIGGIRSLIVKHVSPETSKKIFDTVDSIRNAIVTVSTALFSTDSKARGSAFSRIKSAIGGALKEYVVPPLLKIAAILYTIVRARSAIKTAYSGINFLRGNSDTVRVEDVLRTKSSVTNYNHELMQRLAHDSKYRNSAGEIDHAAVKKAYEQQRKGLGDAYMRNRTFRERFMDLGPIKNIVEGSKQIFASFKDSFKGFKTSLSGINTIISGFHKRTSDFFNKVGFKLNNVTSQIFHFVTTRTTSYFTKLRVAAAGFWASMKVNSVASASSFVKNHPRLASIGRGVGGIARGAAGYARGLFGIIGGAGKLALGVAQGASVVIPIIMMLKELFMKFVMPALSKSGVSAGDSKGVYSTMRDLVSGAITKLFSGVKNLLGAGGLSLFQLTKSILSGFRGVLGGIWEGLKSVVGATSWWDFALKIVKGAGEIILGILSGVVDAATDAMGGIIDSILSFFGVETDRAKGWRDASISDWVMNDEKLKSEYQAFLKEKPRSEAERYAKMLSLVDNSTLAAIDKMSKDAEAREKNSTYRFAIEQKQKADEQKRKEEEARKKAAEEEAAANASTVEESKTDSFRDKISGAVDTLKNYFDAGKFKKDLGSLTETVGDFVKNAFNTIKSFDFRSIGNTIADKLGGFAGSLASGLMGDSSAFTMFGKLEETAKANGYTAVERFAKKARHTIASDVQDIAEFAEKTNMKVSDIYKLLKEGQDFGWNTEKVAKLLVAMNGGHGIASGVSGTGSEAYVNGTITSADIGTISGELSELQGSSQITSYNNPTTQASFGGKSVYAAGTLFALSDKKNLTLTGAYGEDRGDHLHAGIDIAAANSKVLPPVLSPFSGTVKLVENLRNNALGRTVVIEHDKINEQVYTTLYGHLSGFANGLHAGMHVNAGDVIGYMGGSGKKDGEYKEDSFYPHLHFAVGKGTVIPDKHKKTTDPVDFLSKVLSARQNLSTLNAPDGTVISEGVSESGAATGDTSTIVSAATEASRGSFIKHGIDKANAFGYIKDSDIDSLLNSDYFKGLFPTDEERAIAARYIKSDPTLSNDMWWYMTEYDDRQKEFRAQLLASHLAEHLFDIKKAARYESDIGTLLDKEGTENASVQWITAAGANTYGAQFSEIMADNPEVQQLLADYRKIDADKRTKEDNEKFRNRLMTALSKDSRVSAELLKGIGSVATGTQFALVQNLLNNKNVQERSYVGQNWMGGDVVDGGSDTGQIEKDRDRLYNDYWNIFTYGTATPNLP